MAIPQDLIIAAISALPSVLTTLFAIRKVEELHVSVNSRLTELLKVAIAAARAEGHIEGRKEAEKANG